MDTGTHLTMGVALGGLATIDPTVQADPVLFQSIMVGTLVGSHAPDFDTVLKLKSNATYIRNHRGITHSIPAVIIWGLLISTIIYLFVPHVSFMYIWLWTFAAVILHVVVDLFNAYGTQALRPFSDRWIAFGYINTFDPVIFGLHVIGIGAWLLGAHPGYTWLIIYSILILYYIKRYLDKREIVNKIYGHFPATTDVITSPTWRQNEWRVAITTENQFHVGTVKNGHITIVDTFRKKPLPQTEVIEKSKEDRNISAFLSFSPMYRWETVEYSSVTEVRYIDLRYRSKGHYPFVAVVKIDAQKEIVSSYTGWIFSEHKLQHKLGFDEEDILTNSR
ncbi:MAG TPA: metal-dependent hydrolase [Bacillota bacterium]|nr:metal-dependent hydrolase [Bacillota bacterium]